VKLNHKENILVTRLKTNPDRELSLCWGFVILIIMEYRNYLGYYVYENGVVRNKKGFVLKPQKSNSYYFYQIFGKKVSAGQIVLFAFGIFPKHTKQKAFHKDGNSTNNSLSNLIWK
jgi:hypothetical protein